MGGWWADAEKDTYCANWERNRPACYEVLDGGPDAIIWVMPGSGKKFPAKVLQGDQLSPVVTSDVGANCIYLQIGRERSDVREIDFTPSLPCNL